jgi:ABC-2 type transport system permease protein
MSKRHPLVELTKGRWREFRREPSAFFFVIFMPILWMAILGFAFSNPTAETYGVGFQGDAAAQHATTLDALKKNPRVRISEGDEDALHTSLRRGEIQLIVTFADGTTRYVYDPMNRESLHARSFVDDYLQRAAGRNDPLPTVDDKIEVPGTRYIDFLVPGLIALSIMTSSLFGTGMLIVSNRRENLLKRYLATPMRPFHYILSHIFGRCFILAVEVTTILAAAYLMFRFVPSGSFAMLGAFAVLGAGAFTALALLCAARTANPATMNGMTNLVSIPMMLVAGVWFSRGNFPDWIATPARYLPLTALVDGLRRIALEEATFIQLGPETAILAVYLLAGAIAATKLFKWY